MGKRLIKNWNNRALIDSSTINKRLDSVDFFFNDGLLRSEVFSLMKSISDIERIINRFISGHAIPRDLVALRFSLGVIPTITSQLKQGFDLIIQLTGWVDSCEVEYKLLLSAIVDEPPATLQHSGVIHPGYSEELDSILAATKNSREW